VIYGGAGSGKSYAVATLFLIYALRYERSRTLVLMKYKNSIRDAALAQFRRNIANFHLDDYFEVRYSPMRIVCRNGSEILFNGVDNPEKLKSMEGIAAVWMEEASAFNLEDYEQIKLRVRSGDKDAELPIFLTFNPINQNHWLYNYFFQRPNDALILKTTYLDNKHLPLKYVERLQELAITSPQMYRVYAQGEWGQIEGTVYPPFAVSHEYIPKEVDETWFGLDFGYNVPTALVQVSRKETTYHVQEVIYAEGLTNDELISKMSGYFRSHSLAINAPIYCDAAEPARIQALRQSGFSGARAARKEVKEGVLLVQDLHKDIVIHRSVNLAKELQGYVWRNDGTGQKLDEPVKFNDHATDAMRYAFYTHLRSRLNRERKTKIFAGKY